MLFYLVKGKTTRFLIAVSELGVLARACVDTVVGAIVV